MQDPNTLAIWAQIIAVPLAVIAIMVGASVSIFLYLRSKQRKALACSFGPIQFPIEIKAGEALEGDIEIRYKGQTVENLFLVRATLKNIGNVAIRDSHVVKPVTFRFDTDVKLLREPKTLDRKPKDLDIRWTLGEFVPRPEAVQVVTGRTTRSEVNSTYLEFDLLNPGDEFTADFICSGESQMPEASARIEGIRGIEKLDPIQEGQRKLRNQLKVLLILFLTLIMLTLAHVWLIRQDSPLAYLSLVLLICLGGVVLWLRRRWAKES